MYPKRGSAPDPIMCNKKDADETVGVLFYPIMTFYCGHCPLIAYCQGNFNGRAAKKYQKNCMGAKTEAGTARRSLDIFFIAFAV